MEELIQAPSFFLKILILGLLFLVTGAPSVIDNTRATHIVNNQHQQEEKKHPLDTQAPQNPESKIQVGDAAGNAGFTALPGLGDAYITENTGDNADERNTVMRENPTQAIILDTAPPSHNKESSKHQGAMNSVHPEKPKTKYIGTGQPVEASTCSLHDSIHC